VLPKPRSYEFETLTPLWTGDARGRSDARIIESSILGGMRWWAECLARGVGCGVIGKPSDSIYDAEIGERSLDPVSFIFGATSWRRGFRLEVDETAMASSPNNPPENIEVHTGTPNDPKGKGMSRWYLKSPSRKGAFVLVVVPSPRCDVEFLEGLLSFIARNAGFGAKTQLGFGIVRQRSQGPLSSDGLVRWLAGLPRSEGPDVPLPSLDNLFFAEIRVPGPGFEHTFKLKAELRARFQDNQNIRHFLFGKVIKDKREGGKINISLPFGNPPRIRLWGWVPDQFTPLDSSDPISFKREVGVTRIYNILRTHDPQLTWRAINDPRDTVRPTSDPLDFVRSMVPA